MRGHLDDWTYTALRTGTAVLFMEHGLQKLFGMLGGAAVPLMSQMGVAGVLEFAGGILLMLGLFTRPVAAILALEMLVAFVQAHMPRGGWPIQNQGELALLYATIFFFFATHGAGPMSIDEKAGAWTGWYRHRPERLNA